MSDETERFEEIRNEMIDLFLEAKRIVTNSSLTVHEKNRAKYYWISRLEQFLEEEKDANHECTMFETLEHLKSLESAAYEKFCAFLENHGINEEDSYTLEEYTKFVEAFKEEFGEDKEQFFMDCWMPEGEPIAPGIDDSMSHYSFMDVSEEDFNEDWDS